MQTIFNVAVNSIFRHWLSLTVDDEVVLQDRLGHVVGRRLGVFYAYDGILGSRDTEWLQISLNVLIRLFWQINLAANIAKLKTMMCQTGKIRTGMSEEAFGRHNTRKGANYQ